MFSKVLIANRGEIACRIVRTARQLGIRTVGVVSEADIGAMHARMADEVFVIGPAAPAESYLDIVQIIAAARKTGADCIHPGYGFLSENPALAEACGQAGIRFIGPSPDMMRQMGHKDEAKRIAEAAGIPVVPGFQDADADAARLAEQARTLGLPVMIKAVAGGGGRGMRVVEKDADLADSLAAAAREATGAFGDGRLLLERLIRNPRHIEVQVFGDGRGRAVHLFERDCSLQRRHQKVIEEAPAPGLAPELRARMAAAAVKLAETVDYEGAGTVEFLIEGHDTGPDAAFYFIEMNTRLQVEHPVTELITGEDLVAWQFRIAAGEDLPVKQSQIQLTGHAIEARLYAEDPERDFQPSTGTLQVLELPADATGIRIDTGIQPGDEIKPFYDAMVAKVIAHGANRGEALHRLREALGRAVVLGPRTNLRFLHNLLGEPDMAGGNVSTGLIAERMAELTAHSGEAVAVAAGVSALVARAAGRAEAGRAGGRSPWDAADAFQLGGVRIVHRDIVVDGQPRQASLVWRHGALYVGLDNADPVPAAAGADSRIAEADGRVLVWHDRRQTAVAWRAFAAEADADVDRSGEIRSPITGRVLKVHVTGGASVAAGTAVAVVEAMKMEHVLRSTIDGTVVDVAAAEGSQVREGALIAHIIPDDPDEPTSEAAP